MANYVSPGVYVLERDASEYPAAINPSVVGIVGYASKGPVDKATLITNGERLVGTFGEPDEDINGQGLEGALEILEATNSLYFVRCAAASALDASVGIQVGACPAVVVSGGAGDYRVIVKDEAGTEKLDKVVTIAAGDPETTFKAKLGGDPTLASKVMVYDHGASAVLVGGYAGSSASIQVSSTAPTVSEYKYHVSSGPDTVNVTASGATFFASSLQYLVESVYPGAGYNYAKTAAGVETGNSIQIQTEGGEEATLNVYQDGVAAESFLVGFQDTDEFIEKAINTGDENLKSAIIKGSLRSGETDLATTALASFATSISALTSANIGGSTGTSQFVGENDWKFVKLVKSAHTSNKLKSGTNGIPAQTDSLHSTLIGEVTDTGKTGMKVLDNDLLNLSMAAVPGFTADEVQNALITLAEDTKEFLAVVSPPYAVGSVQNAIDWSNGLSTERTAAINSSYAAIYWPWVKVFSPYDGVDRWYDPAIYGIRQMCVTDEVAESWFAPAGFTRGRLTKPTDVEIGLSQGDRDALYSDGNVINPIVNFPQQGITIFGQRTAQRAPSALDRINVRRMMIIIRKIILASTRGFAFEPNDPDTWGQVESLTTSLIDPIARGRGITDFEVTCDSTTNTPDRIEKGELWCKVVIRPTKTAEIIVFELNLVNQSASIS